MTTFARTVVIGCLLFVSPSAELDPYNDRDYFDYATYAKNPWSVGTRKREKKDQKSDRYEQNQLYESDNKENLKFNQKKMDNAEMVDGDENSYLEQQPFPYSKKKRTGPKMCPCYCHNDMCELINGYHPSNERTESSGQHHLFFSSSAKRMTNENENVGEQKDCPESFRSGKDWTEQKCKELEQSVAERLSKLLVRGLSRHLRKENYWNEDKSINIYDRKSDRRMRSTKIRSPLRGWQKVRSILRNSDENKSNSKNTKDDELIQSLIPVVEKLILKELNKEDSIQNQKYDDEEQYDQVLRQSSSDTTPSPRTQNQLVFPGQVRAAADENNFATNRDTQDKTIVDFLSKKLKNALLEDLFPERHSNNNYGEKFVKIHRREAQETKNQPTVKKGNLQTKVKHKKQIIVSNRHNISHTNVNRRTDTANSSLRMDSENPYIIPYIECGDYIPEKSVCWLNHKLGDTVVLATKLASKEDDIHYEAIWEQRIQIYKGGEEVARIEKDIPGYISFSSNRLEIRIHQLKESDMHYNSYRITVRYIYMGNSKMRSAYRGTSSITFIINIIPFDLRSRSKNEETTINIRDHVHLPKNKSYFIGWAMEKSKEETIPLPRTMQVNKDGNILTIKRLSYLATVDCIIYRSNWVFFARRRFLV